MSFFVIFLIIIVALGWLGNRKLKPVATDQSLENTPTSNKPVALTFTSVERQSEAVTSSQSMLSGVNRALDAIDKRIQIRVDVGKATTQPRHEVIIERALIEISWENADRRFKTEQALSRMSPVTRQEYDFERQLIADKPLEKGHDYRRPDFAFPAGNYSDETALAIREAIGTLKAERETYIAETNKRVISHRVLGKYFVEEFTRLGGPSTAQSLTSTPRPVPAPAPPDGVVLRPLAEEEARARTGAVQDTLEQVAAVARLGASTSAIKSESPISAGTMSNFRVEFFEEIKRASAIQAYAEGIGIPYLLHFTDVVNLPRIMKEGLSSLAVLTASGVPFRANDRLRLDGQTDAVSLSIGHPNDKMFAKYRWQNAERGWVVLILSPAILWTLPIAFNRHNAGDKRVSILSKKERMTLDAFEVMFTPSDDLPSRDASNLLAYDPTDVQAEVLVFATIPADLITSVVFDSPANGASHRIAIGQRRSTIETGGFGFFAAHSYVRKTRWTY